MLDNPNTAAMLEVYLYKFPITTDYSALTLLCCLQVGHGLQARAGFVLPVLVPSLSKSKLKAQLETDSLFARASEQVLCGIALGGQIDLLCRGPYFKPCTCR